MIYLAQKIGSLKRSAVTSLGTFAPLAFNSVCGYKYLTGIVGPTWVDENDNPKISEVGKPVLLIICPGLNPVNPIKSGPFLSDN